MPTRVADRPTEPRRAPATQRRALQVAWGLGLVLSILATPVPSLVACAVAFLAYEGSPAWRTLRWVVLGVVVVDLLRLV